MSFNIAAGNFNPSPYEVNLDSSNGASPPPTAQTRFIKPNQNGVVKFWALMKSPNGQTTLFERNLAYCSPEISFNDLTKAIVSENDQFPHDRRASAKVLYYQDEKGDWFKYDLGGGVTTDMNSDIENLIQNNSVL
jgi:hypothetical protein